ncbi:decapping endonuclease targeting mRNA [Paramarasmius palmivorus]|uniref:Decapping endonuclease targeting mRNA n=1 Tax=Paramarasmius palmivorus TaxID=297713 RepID=A0AAW0C0Z8_9AGAR
MLRDFPTTLIISVRRITRGYSRPKNMSKRSISSILNDEPDAGSPQSKVPRTDAQPEVSSSAHPSLPAKPETSEQSTFLAYPDLSGPPIKSPLFQLPTPLTSFSYTPEHVQEFTNSALRYYTPIPPSLLGNSRGGPNRGLDLNYGYERWIRKPEDRGRIDSLLRAVDKVCAREPGDEEGKIMRLKDVSVVAWRGVITR